MSLVAIKQLNQAELTLFVQQASSGAAFSGNMINYVTYSGYLGNYVCYLTGDQVLTGHKTFLVSPSVPYIGGTGDTVSRLYVDNQDTNQYILLTGASGSLYATILSISGLGGGGSPNSVTTTGNEIIGGFKQFTGSPFVPRPTQPSGAANLDLVTGISGVLAAGGNSGPFTGLNSGYSGYVENTFVHRTSVNELVSGVKTFVSSPQVPVPTLPSGVMNILYGSGISGVLVAFTTGISGVLAAGGAVLPYSGYAENTFVHRGQIDETISGRKIFTGALGVGSPISTGDAVNLGYLTGVSGSLVVGQTIYTGTTNIINLSGITGNYVNMSFYFDQSNLATGLNQVECFVSRDFFFTGFAIGTITSGTQGFLTGSLYQRTQINTKTNFADFYLNSGMYFTGVGGFLVTMSGMNRVGLDIFRIGTGITGLSVGVFGVGY